MTSLDLVTTSRRTTAAPALRVFGYCRVSTDRQADSGIGLEEQQRKITAR